MPKLKSFDIDDVVDLKITKLFLGKKNENEEAANVLNRLFETLLKDVSKRTNVYLKKLLKCYQVLLKQAY